MNPTDAKHGADAESSPAAVTQTCLECGSEYSIGRQPSAYCSKTCRRRLKAVIGGRKLLQSDEIDHETIWWVVFVAQPATDAPHRELRRLVGRPLSIDHPNGLPCIVCEARASLRVRLPGQSEEPAAYCIACYRRRLTESLLAEPPADPAAARAVLARIFAAVPLFERDDEARIGYRKLKQQAVRRRLLISSPTATDEADLLAWGEAISERAAAAKQQGLDAADWFDDVVNGSLDDLRLSPRRRNRLVHRLEALVGEFGRSLDLPGRDALTDGGSQDN